MAEYGFFQADNIIIRKRWNSGKRTDYSLTNNYEYAMFFTNGKVKILDKKPLRRYFKTPEEDCVGNVWDIQDTTLNDTVSFDLGELLIRLTNILPGSSVMNPFGGSTSLLRAVMKLGHSFYSWEGNEKNRSKFLNIIKKNKLIKEHV
jgi:DNA modification methylase